MSASMMLDVTAAAGAISITSPASLSIPAPAAPSPGNPGELPFDNVNVECPFPYPLGGDPLLFDDLLMMDDLFDCAIDDFMGIDGHDGDIGGGGGGGGGGALLVNSSHGKGLNLLMEQPRIMIHGDRNGIKRKRSPGLNTSLHSLASMS
jgi:hypothetical protein